MLVQPGSTGRLDYEGERRGWGRETSRCMRLGLAPRAVYIILTTDNNREALLVKNSSSVISKLS